jgi:hypothetical protein
VALNQILLYLLAAFLGGVVAIAALLIAFALSTRSSGGLLSVHFGGGGGVTIYKDLRLLESGVRDGKLYVKYENVGDTETTTACFKVKVYTDGDRLIGESEESTYDTTAPGATNENIIESESLSELLADSSNTTKVMLTYGYVE